MSTVDFNSEAHALREELVARRRDFHEHPELAFEEVRTAGIVAQELSNLGMEVQTSVGKTGVVGMLEGDVDGPTVLVRADMDALPIQELNDVPYASKIPGKMHACGHDAHTTIALGVAKIFSQYRDKIHGRVKFVFQPAEEGAGGAQAMVEDGVLKDPRPDVSLGLHLWNEAPLGNVSVTDGPAMAGASVFRIRLVGKGGHGAMPDTTIDPIICGTQIVSALQTIVSRNVPPLESGVVSVTQFHAGTADNIIPQEVYLSGTTRTFKKEIRRLIEKRMREICEAIASALGCEIFFEFVTGTEPVVNDLDVARRVRDAFKQVNGIDHLETERRTMGAEDVGLFMEDIPGAYFFVGSANSEKGLDYGHHHPRFDFDEDVLPMGVALMSAAVANYVMPDV